MKKRAPYPVSSLIILVMAFGFFTGHEMTASEIVTCDLSAEEYLDADKEHVVIIDVRTKREFDYGHLEGAILIDIYQRSFREKIAELDREKRYFVYCKTGIRSRSAVKYMRQIGFENVCDLEGGTNHLTRAGVKLVR